MTGHARTIFINGRFLSQPMTGVQRFAFEMTTNLDAIVSADAMLRQQRWEILAPCDIPAGLRLQTVQFRRVRPLNGHFWEQLVLPFAARGGLLLNFCNSAPLALRDNIVVLHDAAVFQTPDNFSKAYGMLHRFLGRALAKAAKIATVSEFSRRELSGVLKLDPGEILVLPNGCDHMGGIEADNSILDALGVRNSPYFLLVGSQAPNKNMALAVEAFQRLNRAEAKLVIVGGAASSVFAQSRTGASASVIYAGRAPDAQIASLYRHAVALVFPSRYEGFGIPPLEAMVSGCPVLASDIAPTREVCVDAASYFGANDAAALTMLMVLQLDHPERKPAAAALGFHRSEHFTWRRSANRLVQAIHCTGPSSAPARQTRRLQKSALK